MYTATTSLNCKDLSEWRVESEPDDEGVIDVTIFCGRNAKRRAKQYAWLLNSTNGFPTNPSVVAIFMHYRQLSQAKQQRIDELMGLLKTYNDDINIRECSESIAEILNFDGIDY